MLYRVIIRKTPGPSPKYFVQYIWLDMDLKADDPDIKAKVAYIIMHNDWGTIYDPELAREGQCLLDVIPFPELPEWAESEPIKIDIDQYDWTDEFAEEYWREEYRKCIESPAYFYNSYVVLKDKAGNILPKKYLTDEEIYAGMEAHYNARRRYDNRMSHYTNPFVKKWYDMFKGKMITLTGQLPHE